MTDRIGSLDDRVSVFAPALAVQAGGIAPGAYTLVATIWAAYRADRPALESEGGQPVARNGGTVTVRDFALTRALGPDHRLRFDGAAWAVLSNEPYARATGYRTLRVERALMPQELA